MALNYSITMLGNPQNKNEEKKAYAKAQINGQLSLKLKALPLFIIEGVPRRGEGVENTSYMFTIPLRRFAPPLPNLGEVSINSSN